jgi:peptidoglycan-associated lipoprotein
MMDIQPMEVPHMRSLFPVVMLVGAGGFVGCAHTEKPHADEVTVKAESKPTPPPPQLTATPVLAAPDPMAEINAALGGATVLFGFNEDRLEDQGMTALQKVAKVLRKHADVAVRIEGNCDERGTEEYNLMLGQRRAAVARKYLLDLGVNSKQLDTVSYGAMRPVNPGHSEDAWSQNRRDELHAGR